MFDKLSEIYDEVEINYKKLDKYISKIVDESIEDTSKFFNSYFNSDNTLKIKNEDDEVLQQLSKINNSLEDLNFSNNTNWDKNLVFVATSLGLINEEITKVLCEEFNILLPKKCNQAKKINFLQDFIPRTMHSDLHFINTFRNSILHPNDFNINLFSLDNISKHKLFNEAKTAIAKTYYIYEGLPNLIK